MLLIKTHFKCLHLFKRRILSQRLRWGRRLLSSGPSPRSLLPIQPLPHPTVLDRLFFPTPTPIFSITTTTTTSLSTPSFQDSFKNFHLLVFLLILFQVLLLFPLLILPLILIFCLPLLPIQTYLFFILFCNFIFTKFCTSFLLYI